MEDTMLEIRNLSKSYGEKKAVCNLNLIVEDGDIMGFIGKNGAGKTTTLKSCLGIVGIDKGEILLDGVSILKEPIVCKKKMAYVPDNPQLDEYMTGIQYLILPVILICMILNVFISIFWGSGLLLSDTNIDNLLAFPVPLMVLIISKLSILYLVQAVLDMTLLFPMAVLFGLTADMKISYYPVMAGVVLLFPIIPGLLGTIVGTKVHHILKSSSALVTRLKTIGAVLILFAFMTFMFCKFPDIVAGDTGFNFSISAISIPGSRYVHLILCCDYLSLGLYTGIVLIIGSSLLFGLSRIYQNWYCNIIHHTKYQNTNRNKQSFKQNSLMTALVKRERVRYFSLPVYLTNTACGFLFAAIFVVLIVFMTDKISLYAYQLAEYLKVAPAEYDVFYIFVFTVLVTLSSTTYPSISIEGKQIEILKSLPITAKYIIKSKILLHLSVSGPIILVLNTVMAFYLHWSLEKVMLGYAMPFLYSLFIGIIGCLINIFFPNFEWENITHIIKQSLPAILSALIGTLSTCGTCYLLLKYFSNSLLLGGYIVCGIILLLISILVLCLNRRGEHLYQAL